MRTAIYALALLSLAAWAPAAPAQDEGQLIFRKHVAPVLEEKCGPCHGKQKMSRFGVNSRDELLKGGNRGPALRPGGAKDSLLILALEHSGEVKMPPGAKLPPETIAAFRRWVDLGAPWSETSITTTATAPTPKGGDDTWAFRPVKKPVPPAVAGVTNPIDAFLQRTLAAGATADRRTLLRRATFDLWGLPPTPAELESFLQDASPDAWPRLVDRLLASPRYAERQARRWLDVVRYADTGGFSNDFERPNAWRYRDYVVRSFAHDKPFDRFILEQIAGDELAPGDPEALVATGFLRMGPWEHTAMSVAAVTRQEWLDDVTHSVAASFLGVTLECARCHDHKFDPLPTKDYYRVQAAFASTEFAERPAGFVTGEERPGFAAGRERIAEQIRRNEARLAEYQSLSKQRPLNAEELERQKIFEKRRELYKRAILRYDPMAYSVAPAKSPQDVFILPVGNLQTPGEKVSPGILSAAAWPDSPRDLPASVEGRRLALARWIADPANPLTARVIVNRAWQWHFGAGLVSTPNDFGKLGGRPAHPELLDWLAATFIEDGWSLKKLHRRILLSAAYQAKDSLPQRLDAETIRDSILRVAGELSEEAGGPGTNPEINDDIARQPVQIMGTLMPAYRPSPTRAERHRRTLYTFQRRNLIDPMLDVLNGPSLSESTPKREATVIPTQAFALFNSALLHDMALAFAARAASTADPIGEMFRRAYSREPSAEERRLLASHWERRTAYHERTPPPPVPEHKPLLRAITSELTGAEVRVEEDEEPVRYEDNLQRRDVPARVRALADAALVIFNSNEFIYRY